MTSDDTYLPAPKLSGKCHPACLLLPAMSDAEYRELVEDIRANGQRHPIIADDDGRILDGRHRWRALQEIGGRPLQSGQVGEALVMVYRGTEEQKIALIMSENIHRRHLTTQQRGAIAAELATMKKGARTDLASVDAMSDAQAAKVMGVSEPTVERAKRRMREDPAAHELAKEGKLLKATPKTVRSRLRVTTTKIPAPVYVKQDGDSEVCTKPTGPSLLDALGRLAAFTPQAAENYVHAHPDEEQRLKEAVAIVTALMDDLREILWRHDPKEGRRQAADMAVEEMLDEDGPAAVLALCARAAGLVARLPRAAEQDDDDAPVADPTTLAPAATGSAARQEAAEDPIDELRAWAKSIDFDRLLKHVVVIAPKSSTRLREFLDGKIDGSYQLREAVQQVRDEMRDYAATSGGTLQA
jgi:hypothetical protein